MAEDIQDAFNSMQNKTEIGEVLKELFNLEKREMITELSPDEVCLITKLDGVADIKGMQEYKNITAKFMTLQLSRNRKSRREIIDAVRSLGGVNQKVGGSMLNPMNWLRR